MIRKNQKISLDKFINFCLYDKKVGYYMTKNPFGKMGDFTTAPNISRLFSEMIAIWTVSFWKSLGSPKKFNLIELGAGNGEMMKDLIDTFQNFPVFLNSCNFVIHEKSPFLVNIQKKKLIDTKITWVSKISKLGNNPSIFVANEFFDSIAIRQFRKKKNLWFEKFVNLKEKDNIFFFEKKINIKKIEKNLNFNISRGQTFIEYSELGFNYLRDISKLIKKNTGGLLLFDYGYTEKKMKNTLKAVSNHKIANILNDKGNIDITHNINFNLFKRFVEKMGGLKNNLTSQRNFLLRMGIQQRAEILSRNLNFSKKADIYFRFKRLTDENQMGNLFKVMLIKNQKNKFKLGF